MDIQKAIREFRYNSVILPDPDPSLTIEQVRDTFAALYPEIVNADVEGPETSGAKLIYTFRRAVGTKGTTKVIVEEWLDLHRAMLCFMGECPVRMNDGSPLQLTIDTSHAEGAVVFFGPAAEIAAGRSGA